MTRYYYQSSCDSFTYDNWAACRMYIGKASVNIGAFADGTAFMNLSEKYQPYGEILTKQFGYHSKGNELLYNGMNGEQIETEDFHWPYILYASETYGER